MVKKGSDTLKCNIILGRVSSKLARLEALETDNRTVLDYFKRWNALLPMSLKFLKTLS